jgi:hypothetical protein
VNEINAGNYRQLAVPIGVMPHALRMLGAPAQMLKADASIIKKVLIDKHSGDFKTVTPLRFVEALYKPALVLRGEANDEYELVTDILTDDGPIMFVVKQNTKSGATAPSVGAIMSAYAKPVGGSGNTIAKRIMAGKLAYADTGKMQAAITGQLGALVGAARPDGINNRLAQFSESPPSAVRNANIPLQVTLSKPRNGNFASWTMLNGKIMSGISGKSVKTDDGLMAWIGNNYRGDWGDVPSYSQRVFHGSGQRGIDRLSTDYIGSGYNELVYGWGIYVSKLKDIADFYRESVAGPKIDSIAVEEREIDGVRNWIVTEYDEFGDDLSDANYLLDDELKARFGKVADAILARAEAGDADGQHRVGKIPGQVYEVDIPDDTDMLEWEKSLGAQPKGVQAGVARLKASIDPAWLDGSGFGARWNNNLTGKALYELIQDVISADGMRGPVQKLASGAIRPDKAASLLLLKEGIKGIKHLDSTKGGSKKAAHNYVIFSGEDATIKRPLYSTRLADTDFPAFKRWFDGSKIVDENGDPLVMYHGTGQDFSVFKDGPIYLTKNPVMASVFSQFGDQPNIMPLFVSAKNPFDYENRAHVAKVAKEMGRSANRPKWIESAQEWVQWNADVLPMGEFKTIESEAVQDAIKKAGFDGFWAREGGAKNLAVYRSEQVKSAIGNDGSFDKKNPDIRYSRRTGTSQWDEPTEKSGWDSFVYKFQDKLIDLKRVVQDITKWTGALADDINVYLQEELFHGRTAKRVLDFTQRELNPALNELASYGMKLADLEEYMHARHAAEANAVAARRNPTEPGLQDGGSGMDNAAAAAYFAALPPDDAAKLASVAARFDAIMRETNRLRVEYELESQDTIDAWGRMFQHYVPLFREDKEGSPGLGQGFSVKGKETKGRTGSKRKVVDIIAHIAEAREVTVVRGEKNRVAQALVGLVTAHPNPDFWHVGPPEMERVYNPRTGLVEERVNPLYKSLPNVVMAKIAQTNGQVKEVAVTFNEGNERAVRLSRALKNMDPAQLEGLLGFSAKISRYFSAINTQWNPIFGVVNLVRDVQGAMVNLGTTPLKGKEKQIAKDTLSALIGIYQDIRDERQGLPPQSAWASLYEQFEDDGGQTGFRDMFATSADRTSDIEKTLHPDGWMATKLGKVLTAGGLLKVPASKLGKGWDFVFDWLSDYNTAMENAVRLSAYKQALDMGMSRQQSASLAKNLTVNFNRKGQVGLQYGAVYAFFNAAMQGTARMGATLFDMEPGKPKTLRLSKFGRKVVYGGMLLGTMQAMALAAAGFGEDEPPEFERERSLIIPVGWLGGPEKGYIKIPMPLGLHVIPSMGRLPTEFALGGFKNPEQQAVKVLALFADAFNPIGNAGLSMQTLAPTALDPLVALTENRDWTGKPIARKMFDENKPGYLQGKDSSTWIAKFTSEMINDLTGGNEYVSGVFSPTPDQIDYLIGQVTGGVGRELSKVEQTVKATATGEDLPVFKMPLVGRFTGNASGKAGEGNLYYANMDRIKRADTEIKGLTKDGRLEEAAAMRGSQYGALVAKARVAERQVKRLADQRRALLKAGADRAQVKAVEEQITQAMARLNRFAEEASKKYGAASCACTG